MTTVQFTYYAKPLPDGRYRVNLHLKQIEPTWTDTPHAERKALADAAQLVKELVGENADLHPDSGLLVGCDPDADAFPIFMFAVGVSWNRALKIPHYSRVCYQRYEMDGKWASVASLGMEQYDYTMSILRKREKIDIAEALQKKEANK